MDELRAMKIANKALAEAAEADRKRIAELEANIRLVNGWTAEWRVRAEAAEAQIKVLTDAANKILAGRKVWCGEGDNRHTEVESLQTDVIENILEAALASLEPK